MTCQQQAEVVEPYTQGYPLVLGYVATILTC